MDLATRNNERIFESIGYLVGETARLTSVPAAPANGFGEGARAASGAMKPPGCGA